MVERTTILKKWGQIAVMRRYLVDRVWNAEGWEAKLIDRYFLAKLRGHNDAQKRHNATVYAQKSRTHRQWSGIAAAFIAFGLITYLIEWNVEQLKTSIWLLIGALAWFHYSGRVEQLFLNVIGEIDERVAGDPDAEARFAEQQIGVERALEVQLADQAQKDYDNGTESLQYKLQSLHNDLGRALERGDVRLAGVVRGDIAKVESQLRSRGS